MGRTRPVGPQNSDVTSCICGERSCWTEPVRPKTHNFFRIPEISSAYTIALERGWWPGHHRPGAKRTVVAVAPTSLPEPSDKNYCLALWRLAAIQEEAEIDTQSESFKKSTRRISKQNGSCFRLQLGYRRCRKHRNRSRGIGL